MAKPLDGARLKIVRAKQHLDHLKEFVGQYVDSDLHSITIEKNDDLIETRFNIGEPDPIISAIAGDCLTNCRAALDYIIWELGEKYIGRPLAGSPFGKDRIYFPICNDPMSFSKSRQSLALYKIPASALDLLEALQPYKGGNDVLRALNLLVNIDKHRLPLLMFGQVGAVSLTVNLSERNYSETISAKVLNDAAMALDSGMEVQSQATFYVAWGYEFMPSMPIENALEQIIQDVSDTVVRFETFFE